MFELLILCTAKSTADESGEVCWPWHPERRVGTAGSVPDLDIVLPSEHLS